MTFDEAKLEIAVIKAQRKAFSRGKASVIGLWLSSSGGVEIGRAIWGGPLLDMPESYGMVVGILAVVVGFYLFARNNDVHGGDAWQGVD